MGSEPDTTPHVASGTRLWLLVDHDRSSGPLGLVNVGETHLALELIDEWIAADPVRRDYFDHDGEVFEPARFAADPPSDVAALIVVDTSWQGGYYRYEWVTIDVIEMVVM